MTLPDSRPPEFEGMRELASVLRERAAHADNAEQAESLRASATKIETADAKLWAALVEGKKQVEEFKVRRAEAEASARRHRFFKWLTIVAAIAAVFVIKIINR